MNERIKKLAEQANEKISYSVDPHTFSEIDDPNGPFARFEFNKEKFAEFIVRECSQFVEDKFDFFGDEIIIAYEILKHFGVEE